MKQKELFYRFAGIGFRVKELGTFIQNDMEKMLKDGLITNEQIAENMKKFEKDCDHILEELVELKNTTINFVKTLQKGE